MTTSASVLTTMNEVDHNTKNPIPSLAALFLCGLYPMTKIRRNLLVVGRGKGVGGSSNNSRSLVYLIDLIVALIVYWKLNIQSSSSSPSAATTKSIVPFWSLLTSLTCKLWPALISKTITTTTTTKKDNDSGLVLLQMFIHGGPLGYGCKKVVEVLVAILLWQFFKKSWPSITIFPVPSLKEWIFVVILSLVVNGVLQIWSTTTKSRGNHPGVNDMVKSTHGRSLSNIEHIQIFILAVVNASCEEITTRYFWRTEIEYYLPSSLPQSNSTPTSDYDWMFSSKSNLLQAILFGLWHYHGIPSGWIGVGLTFVYGYVMGILQDYSSGGLFLSILTHSIADYYIFAIIARQKQQGGGGSKHKHG